MCVHVFASARSSSCKDIVTPLLASSKGSPLPPEPSIVWAFGARLCVCVRLISSQRDDYVWLHCPHPHRVPRRSGLVPRLTTNAQRVWDAISLRAGSMNKFARNRGCGLGSWPCFVVLALARHALPRLSSASNLRPQASGATSHPPFPLHPSPLGHWGAQGSDLWTRHGVLRVCESKSNALKPLGVSRTQIGQRIRCLWSLLHSILIALDRLAGVEPRDCRIQPGTSR